MRSHSLPHSVAFVSCVTLSLAALMGCQSRKYNNAQTKADPGIPKAVNVKFKDSTTYRGFVEFVFEEKDPKTGAVVGTHTTYATGSTYDKVHTFVRDPKSPVSGDNVYGSPTIDKLDEKYAFITNTPWLCRNVEQVMFGKVLSTLPDQKDQLCLFAVHTTGSIGEAAADIIGLDSKAGSGGTIDAAAVKGAVDSYASKAPGYAGTRDALNAQAAATRIDLTSGVVSKPNNGINIAQATAAIKEVYEAFRKDVDDKERGTCLNNFRTVESNWTDLAVHYWCQFPVDPTRDRYVNLIVKLRDAQSAGLTTQPPPLVRAAGAKKLHTTVLALLSSKDFTNPLTKKPDVGDPNLMWIAETPERKATFLTIMTSLSPLNDFNIDQEQEAINAFYNSIGKERPRRINDTYPQWLEEQPRYVDARLSQAAITANWDKMVAAAAAFSAAAAAPSP